MNVFTHALLPVIMAATLVPPPLRPARRGMVVIGVAGALPDLLNPHLTLEARMTSWSHGLPFFLAVSCVVLVAYLLAKGRLPGMLALMSGAAYLLHLFCDALSGGVDWLYPVAHGAWGAFWVHPLLWIPLDIVCLLTCYVLFRWRPARRAAQTHH